MRSFPPTQSQWILKHETQSDSALPLMVLRGGTWAFLSNLQFRVKENKKPSQLEAGTWKETEHHWGEVQNTEIQDLLIVTWPTSGACVAALERWWLPSNPIFTSKGGASPRNSVTQTYGSYRLCISLPVSVFKPHNWGP